MSEGLWTFLIGLSSLVLGVVLVWCGWSLAHMYPVWYVVAPGMLVVSWGVIFLLLAAMLLRDVNRGQNLST